LDSLHDRFRLLTGGARTAVRRQQTLRASVDWSHALLTEPEQVLFRRLAVFAGGFDLDAAQAVGADGEVERYQLLDQLSLLVDKSLVVADDTGTGMRYRLLETVRQYAQEKLGESGEADQVRTRHRDYYTTKAVAFGSQGLSGVDSLLLWAQREIENLRTAYGWSRENSDIETAMRLILSLQPLWLRAGRVGEALAGLDAVLTDEGPLPIAPAVRAGAVIERQFLAAWLGLPTELSAAQDALAVARQLNDPALITRALITCGMSAVYTPEVGQRYFAEATELVRAAGDRWTLCQILSHQATVGAMSGEPTAARAAAEEGRDLADALGDRFYSRNCRAWLVVALMMQGYLAEAAEIARCLAAEAAEAGDALMNVYGCLVHGVVLARQGHGPAAHAAGQSAGIAAEVLGRVSEDSVYAVLADAALAAGDGTAAMQFCERAWKHSNPLREVFTRSTNPIAQAALASGDVPTARRWADENIALTPGWQRVPALVVRAYIAMAQGDPGQAERDAYEALAIANCTRGYLHVDDALECLARLAAATGSHQHAARLLGAAEAIRQRMDHPRFPMYETDYEATVAKIREALEQKDIDVAWAHGAALSTEEAIAYAQRGRGERKRPATGWTSLTPMETDVVRLVSEGLGNKEIGARLFISPRTVQTHLTHVYAKLGLTSRVQLVQEAGRHA
jgi:DNA-binding CsgD family transcriptional regulator